MMASIINVGKFYFSSFAGLTSNSWKGITLSLFESALIGIFYYLSMYFVNDLKLSVATSGMIISFYGVGAILGSYIAGTLSDRISPVYISTIALIIQSIAFFALVKLMLVKWLIIDVFCLGIASYGFITSNHLFVMNACKGGETIRLKALNILAAASNLGGGIAGLLFGFLLYYGFHNVFLYTSALLLILAMLTISTNSNEICIKNQLSDAATDKNESEGHYFTRPTLYMVLCSVLFVGAVVAQLGTSYTLYIQQIFSGEGIKVVSILFALNSFMVVLISTPLGELCSKYNKILMVGLGGFLIGLGMFLLCLAHTFYFAAFACIVYTFGEMIFFSMAQYVCYHSGEVSKRGRNLGLFRVMFASSRVLGPLIGGIVFQRFGGDVVWYISGAIGLLGLMGCYYFYQSQNEVILGYKSR